jgi:hypothetical protein
MSTATVAAKGRLLIIKVPASHHLVDYAISLRNERENPEG